MASDEKLVTVEDIDLSDVHMKLDKYIWKMLKRHQKMWDGSLGDTTVMEHCICVKPDARPVKAQPYRSGLKARELERLEIEKQLAVDVIEPGN